ncbi:MAG: Xaa-Pro peptidase family protein [Deltaproteobacteria bacterium]|jgi:Xaa-Pro aminopeptidase|nr:Xaa-Pro peptidase family protein [Deltaproteobacteria bacterium]
MELTKSELEQRCKKFKRLMDETFPEWNTAVIFSQVNQYYFTGTMQDALLLINKEGAAHLFVRRSFERAKSEALFGEVYPMTRYNDVAGKLGADLGNIYIDATSAPYASVERLGKSLKFSLKGSLETLLRNQRSVKSEYELYWLKIAGTLSNQLLTEIVPGLMREGVSESDFYSEVANQMVKLGHQGVVRFWRYGAEIVIGHCCFGENALHPSYFEGVVGSKGNSPASPIVGNRQTFLKKGDLVLVDITFALRGYHTDKTVVYSFGTPASQEVQKAHALCLELQRSVAQRLVPGAIPSKIYSDVMQQLSQEDKKGFMGLDSEAVSFLGHGVGLHVDELPVIAKGFDAPLEQNMVFAVEPKKAVKGHGIAGVEDTFLVTPEGGLCLTGGGRDIIKV